MVDSSGHSGIPGASDAHLTLSGLAFLQYQEVIHKFAALRSAICKSLIDRKVSVKEFVRVLNNLGAYAPHSGHAQKSLYDNHLKEFKKAKTISDALLFLAEDSSFLEYHIFEHIASELGSPGDQALVREYKGHLENYCTRNILECPSYSFGKVDHITIYLKAKIELEHQTISQLQLGFHSQVAQVLGVANYTLCLLSVARDQGCVQLMYQLPRFVKETVFPLTGQQEVALETTGVLELTCESYQMSTIANSYHPGYPPPHAVGSTASSFPANGSLSKSNSSTQQPSQRGKGSGRRGRGGASSRRSKGSSNDDQEMDNSPTASGPSLKDQAAELLANQFLTVPSAGDGPSTSRQIQTQFISEDPKSAGDHSSDDDEPQEKPKPAPGKKTRGRVKIPMEYIKNKLRRYTTFSKRKSNIMKKAYELSTLTGTQVMLMVASETGHVYTFATPKLQPMITSEAGKALIQTCLHQPDLPPSAAAAAAAAAASVSSGPPEQYDSTRMSASGFEETDLNNSYQGNGQGSKSPPSSRGGPSVVPSSSIGTSSSPVGVGSGSGGLVPGGPPPPLLYSTNPALHLSSDIAALMPGIQGFGAHPLLGAGLGNYSPTQAGGEGPPPPPHHPSEMGDRDHHRAGGPRSGSPNQDTD